MAAHSALAKMQKMPDSVLESLRNGKPIEDSRLEALRKLTQSIVQRRGWIEDRDLKSFLLAGYSKAQVLELLVGVAQKTISNYVNHLADTPVDQAFK
jgi:alkylhydroperoxidase family enzyme